MKKEITQLNQGERKALAKLPVSALILFGSRAQGIARPNSDYDIGVLLSDIEILNNSDKRRQLYDALYDIWERKISDLVDIDIVFLEDAPLELKVHVMKYGRPIFMTRKTALADFKQAVMLESADFAPLHDIFQQGVLARIK